MKPFLYNTYAITESVFAALVNADFTGLSDDEIQCVEYFENQFKGFDVAYDLIEDEASFKKCDILGEYSDCVSVNVYYQLIYIEDDKYVNYLPEKFVYKKETTPAPRTNNVSGYGSKIPTTHLLHCIDGRKRRVYAICYGNAASHYIRVNGKQFFLNSTFFD